MNYWQGEKIKLRAPELSDVDSFVALNRDNELQRAVHYIVYPSGKSSVEKWLNRMAETANQNDNFFLVIESNDGRFAGDINSHETDRRVGSFSYGISVLPEFRRRGFASEAIRLLLAYFFLELNYQKCTTGAASFNEASIALHKKLGFAEEGRIRRMVYTEGKYYDRIVFGITREDFLAKYPAK